MIKKQTGINCQNTGFVNRHVTGFDNFVTGHSGSDLVDRSERLRLAGKLL